MKKVIIGLMLSSIIINVEDSFGQGRDQMQARHEYMMIGEMHVMMRNWTGRWREEIKAYEDDPTKPPVLNHGLCENKMIMGDRFLSSTHRGEINHMPFEGESVLGWDNARKIFVNSWIDNLATGITYMEGSYDAKTKTLALTGNATDPLTGQLTPIRQLIKITDKDHQTIELYMMGKEKEYKSLEIKLTRIP